MTPATSTLLLAALLITCGCSSMRTATTTTNTDQPFLIVLGTAQDGGIPQANNVNHPARKDPSLRRNVVCLGIIDPASGKHWLIEATPDFRDQFHTLRAARPNPDDPQPLSGVFLTHAHIGHYTGLMFLGHESLGARAVPVHAMPRMKSFLETNAPWQQLVTKRNIDIQTMTDAEPVRLTHNLSVTPFLVPHRQEYSEVVGFRIDGPTNAALFIPDIDAWTDWDQWGVRLEDMLAGVDVAYLDGTFFDANELPGRDMSTFPHPFITTTINRLASLPESERAKVRFIHLNHSNPAQYEDSPARRTVNDAAMHVASDNERLPL